MKIMSRMSLLWICAAMMLGVIVSAPGCLAKDNGPDLVLSCSVENDLYQVLTANKVACRRYDSPSAAVSQASEGAGVLILADGYPENRSVVDASLFAMAASKKLKVYVEYPSMLPDLSLGDARYVQCGGYGSILERTVVSSDAFGADLPKMRIVVVQDCTLLPVTVESPHMVLARIVGYDTAALGLPEETSPILFEHPEQSNIMVATTKLSQFVTGRYAPKEAWGAVWRMILGWAEPGQAIPELTWEPTVATTFGGDETLPANAQLNAIKRGAEYYQRSRLLVDESGLDFNVDKWMIPEEKVGLKPWPADWKTGDGSYGILECYISKRVFLDGSQAINPATRTDCCMESSMGLALGAEVLNNPEMKRIAANINDFIYFKANVSQGPRSDPNSAAYGMLGHNIAMPGKHHYWSDDHARAILGCITSSALIKSDRWDEAIARTILADFRTTGPKGYHAAGLITHGALMGNGWQHYWNWAGTDFSPHYQAYIWATYLWLYDKTKFEPLLDRARMGIRLMMEAYPDGWSAECGRMEEERAHMLLPLAWLVRAEDRPEHREWLEMMAQFIFDTQAPCGAVPQMVDVPYTSNAQYGTGEAPIVYASGDPGTDLLYTLNFAFIGMHEAAAATGDARYVRAEDKMADFLIRIQTSSEAHPELDGTWFRAFDFDKWEYWGSDGDAGWGVWSNEIGWTHSWITATLALREMKTNLWDVSKDHGIAKHFDRLRQQMLPDEVLNPPLPERGEQPDNSYVVSSYRYTGGSVAGPHARVEDGATPYVLTDNHITTQAQIDAAAGNPWGFNVNGGQHNGVIYGGDPQPGIRFDLGQRVSLGEVEIHYCSEYRLGVGSPTAVDISVDDTFVKTFTGFDLSANVNKYGDARSVSVDLAGVTGQYIQLDFHNIDQTPPGSEWVGLDEVVFYKPEASTGSSKRFRATEPKLYYLIEHCRSGERG